VSETVVRMWEARVAPGRLAEAEAWMRTSVLAPALAAGALAAEGFRAAAPEERLVAITRWASADEWVEPDPPVDLIARAHAWGFAPIGP
jgi:hypothetical protein